MAGTPTGSPQKRRNTRADYMRRDTDTDYMCVGDHVCLYCEDTDGYVFSELATSERNVLYTFADQDVAKPEGIHNPQVVTFRIHVQNRYRLHKAHQELLDELASDPLNEQLSIKLEQAKKDADNENKDNIAEQLRLHGKVVKYGDIIQLRHTFSNKYIHSNPDVMSSRDDGSLLTYLDENNAKSAQFRILPKYKLNTEGDDVCCGDHIVLESFKSPGYFLHATEPFSYFNEQTRCELNCAVTRHEFTVTKRFVTRAADNCEFPHGLWGGVVLQLHHKHLEAYLCATGLEADSKPNNVSLHVQEADMLRPETLYPPQSSTTFWQVLPEFSSIDGEMLCWGSQVRLQHFTSHQYLYVDRENNLGLTDDGSNARAVFRIHQMHRRGVDTGPRSMSVSRNVFGYVDDAALARIEHVITGTWLHGDADTDVGFAEVLPQNEALKSTLVKKISVTSELVFYDAFCLQKISMEQLNDANLVLGICPVITYSLLQLSDNKELDEDQISEVTQALIQLTNFLEQPFESKRQKTRKTFLRELKIIDQLVALLQQLTSKNLQLEIPHLVHSISQVFMASIRLDTDNCLYVTQFMDFFQNHISMKEGNPIGASMIQIMLELIRDRRDVINLITKKQIDRIIFYFRKYQHSRYLKVLSGLCYCGQEAIVENQIYVAQQILNIDKTCLYNFVYENNEVCVVSKSATEPIPLTSICVDTDMTDDHSLLVEQLNLFINLCKGRNQYCINALTTEQCFVTWDVAFWVLQSPDVPSDTRARFCQLIITLFVDVSENTSLLESSPFTYLYDRLDINKSADKWIDQMAQFVERSLDNRVPRLQKWLYDFLNNSVQSSQDTTLQPLILVVWELVFVLIEYGYYSLTKIQEICPIIIDELRGNQERDLDKKQNYDCTQDKSMEIKYRIMLLLELIIELQFRYQVEIFIATYKDVECRELLSAKQRTLLVDFLHEFQEKVSIFSWTSPKTELRHTLENIVKLSPMPIPKLERILMCVADDVRGSSCAEVKGSGCAHEKIITKSLFLLRNHYKRRSRLLQAAEKAVILVTEASCSLYKNVQPFMPLLGRLLAAQLDADRSNIVCAILDNFEKCCIKEDNTTSGQVNVVGQNILVNQGILTMLLQLLETKSKHTCSKEDVELTESVVQHTLEVLQTLCRENQHVQEHLYNHLDVLLHVSHAPRALAGTLKMIFNKNPGLCERVDTCEVQQIVRLTFQHKTRAPNFLQVLKILLQPEGDDDNISMRMKHIIRKIGIDLHAQLGLKILRMTPQVKEEVLMGKHGHELLSYFINITNVISLTSKETGEHGKSFSSSVFSTKDVLSILCNPDISCNVKRPFLKLFHWVLLPHKGHIVQTKMFWTFMDSLSQELDNIQACITQNGLPILEHVDDCFMPSEKTSEAKILVSNVIYFIDAVLPFLKTSSRMYQRIPQHNNKYIGIYRHIVGAAMNTFPLIVATTKVETHLDKICCCLRAMMESCCYGEGAITDVLEVMRNNFAKRYPHPQQSEHDNPHVQKELDLERKLQTFVNNCKRLNIPVNTVEKQLGCKERKYAKNLYTEIGSGKQLPLSDEFQDHARSFICTQYSVTNMRYKNTTILIKQLEIVASVIDKTSVVNQMLVHSCLQILRALVHNIIVLLPEDIFTSKKKKKKYRIRVEQLQELQELYVECGLVHLVMTLIGTQNQAIFRESLALLECMLYGASQNVQNSALDFFETTREEALFMIISDFLKYSANFMKERRSVAHKALRQSSKVNHGNEIQPKKGLFVTFLPPKKLSKVGVEAPAKDGKMNSIKTHQKQGSIQEELLKMNTCTVQLILKVVAKLAEGHHTGLQDYLREQPDNLKSYNIIAAVAHYLGHMYNLIQSDNIDLAVDIFYTLREMCLGNQKNRLVILDNKIVDYVNYILKQTSFEGCSTKDILRLKKSISSLLISMVEENCPNGLKVAQDIAETLDLEALLLTMERCRHVQEEAELASVVGQKMYITYARMSDVVEHNSEIQRLSINYKTTLALYNTGVPSVEIIKDGHLQRVYFAFVNRRDIRSDLKQKLKWNVDRTSPTNKIMDFTRWAKVIIKDYYYQQRVMSNCLGRLLVEHRKLWDVLLILISLVINLFMLVCWVSPADPTHLLNNQTEPHQLYLSKPELRIDFPRYRYGFWTCRVSHNLVSSILFIAYFLSQHPSLPQCSKRKRTQMPGRAEDGEDMLTSRHDYNAKLFSTRTAYHLVLLILSITGSVVTAYCFAFHMLHIVEVNTLLHGVIRAITKNGKSLLWVAILGVVILYIYGLIGFAFFTHVFDSSSQLYCQTLYECTATVTTYGLLGLLGENISLHSEDSFITFLFWSLYQITFFIFFTTIGLNIIFGIIVDTFSELRDLKWRAEQDMQDVCFICGLPSYDFEHHTKGFHHHVHHEHNMWTYIYYFIYLSTTNRGDYTALDHYVADQRRRGLTEFFPVNRALSLSAMETDTEDGLAELKADIAFLKQRQLQTDRERQLHEQTKDQKQWRRAVAKRKSQGIMLTRVDTQSPDSASSNKK